MGKQIGLEKLWKRYIGSAKTRQLSFKLSYLEFKDLTSKKCFYCGRRPKQECKSTIDIYYYNGIDRINSDKGYEFHNTCSCCSTCNMMKGTLSHYEFIDQCKAVTDHITERQMAVTMEWQEECFEDFIEEQKYKDVPDIPDEVGDMLEEIHEKEKAK